MYCEGKIIPDADPTTAELTDNGMYLSVAVNGTPNLYYSDSCAISYG